MIFVVLFVIWTKPPWWPSGRAFSVCKISALIYQVRSKSEKSTPVASLVNLHHLRTSAGLVGLVSV